jgi:hypothetical protein
VTLNYTEISQCRGCGSKELRSVLDLGMQYIVNFVDNAKETADSAPIHLVVCMNCRLVQLKHTVHPDRLFRDYFYYSGVNTTMREHLADLVNQAQTIETVTAGDYVISIGENDGWMLSNFPRNVNTIGIEPARNMMPQLRKNCTLALNDYFSESAVAYLKEHRIKAKHIYAISMFYDISEPEEFLDSIKTVLHRDGIFVVQMNYLRTMMENVAIDNVLHEHLMYYNIQSLEPLLTRSKLKIFHVSFNDLNGGSVRLYICHDEADKITYFNYMQALVDENKWFGPASDSKLMDKLQFFSKRVTDGRDKLQKFIKEEIAKHKIIYAYGASTRGASLLQVMGLKYPTIKAAVERNPIKVDKWMAGLNIPIISEESMRKAPPDYLLLLPYWFLPEFKEREIEFLENGGRFIIPLPNPYVFEHGDKVTLL